VIDGIGGAVVCGSGLGTVVCLVGGLTIAATNVGSDFENGCSPGRTAVDAGVGIAGSAFGAFTSIGGAALDGTPIWMREIYNGTTGAPSAGASALQSNSGSRC
jgi:hypothetical protein